MTDDHRTKYEVIGGLSEGILKLLEDLYQSGFNTVHDSTLEELKKSAELTGQYGMEYLSGLLGQITEELSARRHQTDERRQSMASAAELYTSLNEYLCLSRQKAAYDRGLDYYTKTEEDEQP